MIICILFGIAAIISFIQLVMLINRGGKEQNIYQILMYTMCAVCNVGYFALAISKSTDMAIVCNNITYLGAVFLPLMVLMRTADLCGVKIKKTTVATLTMGSLFAFFLVFSTGYSNIYYSNVSIKKTFGATQMVKEYGPAHNTYKILLIIYVLFTIGVVIKAYKERKQIAKKTVFGMLAITVVPCIIYLLERILNCPIELLPFTYVVVLGLYLNIINKLKMYDMTESLTGVYEKLEECGYITFDLKKRLMSYNQMANKIFPELRDFEIDEETKNDESVFYNEIIKWLDTADSDCGKEKKIEVNNRIIKCKIRKIYTGFRQKCIGYSVELIDNTSEEMYVKLLNNYNSKLSKEVNEKTQHIRNMQNSIITGMATVVEGRDNSTGGHVKRTSECVKVFTDSIKWKMPDVNINFLSNVIKAAPMHDLGKIAVDDEVLRKPGKFTDEEYAKMKTHSAKGAQIVAEVLKEVQDEEFKKVAINVAHYHHERWDGSGYPEGLSGNDIPLEARIMALADVFDALVSKRCYKEAFNYDRAFNIIEESLGSHFDPMLGKIFIECRSDLEKLYNELPE